MVEYEMGVVGGKVKCNCCLIWAVHDNINNVDYTLCVCVCIICNWAADQC